MDKLSVFNMNDLMKKDVIMIYRNDEDKRFHLIESQSLISHVHYMFMSQIYFPQFVQLKNDIEQNKVRTEILLETCSDRFIRKTRLLKYRTDMINAGYTEYSSTKYTKTKVRLEIMPINKKMYILVYMVVGRKARTVLGVFDKMDEAKAFFNAYYKSGKIHDDIGIMICDNELTKKISDTMVFV